MRCGPKGLSTITNAFKLIGFDRLANSTKTYAHFLSKSTNHTDHLLIFGSIQDKKLFFQPKCLKNLRANADQFLPNNEKCHLIKDFTEFRQLIIPTHNIINENEILKEACVLKNSFSLNLDLICTQNAQTEVDPKNLMWIAQNTLRIFEEQLENCNEIYTKKKKITTLYYPSTREFFPDEIFQATKLVKK